MMGSSSEIGESFQEKKAPAWDPGPRGPFRCRCRFHTSAWGYPSGSLVNFEYEEAQRRIFPAAKAEKRARLSVFCGVPCIVAIDSSDIPSAGLSNPNGGRCGFHYPVAPVHLSEMMRALW